MTPWTAGCKTSLSFAISWSFLRLMSIESMIWFHHLIFCLPLLLLPSIFPSIKVFSSELALHIRLPKYWSFSFSISPFIEYSGLISDELIWSPCCPRDCQDSSPALQFKSINSSMLSLLYGPILSSIHEKTIALTLQAFVSKVISLLFNTLSRFIIAFPPRSKCLLISWLQSPSAVILEPKRIKSATVSTFSLSICHEVVEPDAMIFIFWMLSFKPAFSLFHPYQEAL